MAKGFIKAKINGDDCLVSIKGDIDTPEIIAGTVAIVMGVAEVMSIDATKLAKRICKACESIENKDAHIIEVCEIDLTETEGEEND